MDSPQGVAVSVAVAERRDARDDLGVGFTSFILDFDVLGTVSGGGFHPRISDAPLSTLSALAAAILKGFDFRRFGIQLDDLRQRLFTVGTPENDFHFQLGVFPQHFIYSRLA